MRDYLLIGVALAALSLLWIADRQQRRIGTLTTERDTAQAVAEGYRQRAELGRLIAEQATAEHALTAARLAEIEARGPERVTVYRDRVRVIEPLPAVCGPGADRVAAVNEALR